MSDSLFKTKLECDQLNWSVKSYLPKDFDRLKGAARLPKGTRWLLPGHRVIRSCGTDKLKQRQSCFVGAFRKAIEPP